MRSLIQFLKPTDTIIKLMEKLIGDFEKQGGTEQESKEYLKRLEARANEHHLPYLIFARDIVDRIMQNKESSACLEATKIEVCGYLSTAVKCFNESNIIDAVYRPSVENMVFSLF